jgi:nicotinate-nucleotide adenylyltransferase
MTSGRRIGILGGTFDPIHTGHIDLAAAAAARLGLTQVLVMPSNIPPHRPQPLASSLHRFAMVAMAVAGRDGWLAADLELLVDGPSFTTDTIRHFHEQGCSPKELFFIIGADAFAEIPTWRDYPNIVERANFAVVSRPGHPVRALPAVLPDLEPRMHRISADQPIDRMSDAAPGRLPDSAPVIFLIDAPTAAVSATAIRRLRSEGATIAGMVDPRVQQHIEQHGLYTSRARGRRADAFVDIPAAGRLHGQS